MRDSGRIGLLVPMEPELRPIAEALGLLPSRVGDLDVHTGRHGQFEIVALVTGMGPAAAAEAAARLLDVVEVESVLVAGVAGGVDRSLSIGSVVVPAVVVDHGSRNRFIPAAFGDLPNSGTLLTTDGFLAPTALLSIEPPITAVDMETSAIAHVCATRGTPWSVIRVVSDRVEDGLVDTSVFELGGTDGTADHETLRHFLSSHPEAAARLSQIASDFEAATDVLAETVRQAF